MSGDVISQSIGDYGRWQLLLTFLLSLFNIPCTWHIFAPTFHARDIDAWCARPANFSGVEPALWRNYTQPAHDVCSIIDASYIELTPDGHGVHILNGAREVPCTEWEFQQDGSTIISEFQLMCDRKQLINIAEMTFLGGVAIGGLVCGLISDRYGRKKTLMASVLIQTILGISVAFTPSFLLYLILRTALGFISVSVVFSGFVLSIELVGGIWRTVAGISYLFPLSLSYALISGMAYVLRDWRHLQLAISLPGILFLSYWWFLPESPRWLLAMHRYDQVYTIVQRAAKFNRRELPDNLDKWLLPSADDAATTNNEISVGILDLFKTRRLRKITFSLFIIWFCVYLIYYGLVLNMGNIGGDLYINSILSGLVEFPAIAISIVFLLRMGRRWPLCLTIKFAGVACLLSVAAPYVCSNCQWLKTTLVMTGKFLISSSNAVMPVFTAELFPTTIRNVGVGASNLSAGVALMLVPYLWEMAMVHDCVPMSVIGICGIIGGLCVLILPETANDPLQDTIDDNEDNKEVK